MLSDKVKELQEERRILDEENSALKSANQIFSIDIEKITTEANSYNTNTENELFNLRELYYSTKKEILGRGIDDKSDKKINISGMQINPN
jgi:hypothetical protein